VPGYFPYMAQATQTLGEVFIKKIKYGHGFLFKQSMRNDGAIIKDADGIILKINPSPFLILPFKPVGFEKKNVGKVWQKNPLLLSAFEIIQGFNGLSGNSPVLGFLYLNRF
jgi:hypothetical protein